MSDFTPLLKRLEARGIRPNTNAARNWFRTKVSETQISRKSLLADSARGFSGLELGAMYCYSYDPKFKLKLKYYDEFPLIFVIEKTSNGFVGINLHYVSPQRRLFIMESLSKVVSDSRYNKETKLKISYNILKALSKYNVIKPCLKRYLYTKVRGTFVKIDANEWDIAVFLPVQKFQKAPAAKVWAESARSR
jgi:hypothetical protein